MSDDKESRPPQAIPIEESNRQNRRKLLKWLGIGAVGLAGGTEISLNAQQLADFFANLQLTDEQKTALEEYKKAPPEKIVHHLEVGPNGARLRSDPYSVDREDPSKDKRNYLATLAAGTPVDYAIEVEGNDPNHPTDQRFKAKWYFIPSNDARSGAFSYSGNFTEKSPQVASSEPKR